MTPISVGRSLLVIAGLGAFLAGPASAAVITQWGYTLSSEFTAATFNDDNPALRGFTPLQLSWGNAALAARSSLTLGNPVPGTVDTFIGGGLPPAAFIAAGNSITHDNKPIPAANPDLNVASLQSALTLQALLPVGPGVPGPVFPLPNLVFDIKFKETPNSPPCAAASPPGNPCNDIFVLITGLLNQSFEYDSDFGGPDGPVTYFINVFPTTGGVLSMLTDAECAAAGADPDCIGFTTPENDDTALAFGFTISTKPLGVPEPGSLALLGLAALIGAGFVRVRRKS